MEVQNYAPELKNTELDLFVQTSPLPYPNPNPAPYLHGQQRANTDVYVIWRCDIPSIESKHILNSVRDTIMMLTPNQREQMAVPAHELKRWLLGQDQHHPISDLDTCKTNEVNPRTQEKDNLLVFCWKGKESKIIHANDIKPGDIIILNSQMGGADEYGWNPLISDKPIRVSDVAESCQFERLKNKSTKKSILRLAPELLEQWVNEASQETIQLKYDQLLESKDPETNRLAREDVKEFLLTLRDRLSDCSSISDLMSHLINNNFNIIPYPDRSDAFALSCGVELAEIGFEDALSHLKPVLLSQHLPGVRNKVAYLATCLGLPGSLINDLMLSADGHDLGKAEIRNQKMLHYGLESYDTEVLAKSTIDWGDWESMKKASTASGMPSGFRHEFLSVAMLQNEKHMLEKAIDKELVLYLVGTHHGRGRPWPDPVLDDAPTQVEFSYQEHDFNSSSHYNLFSVEAEWPELFWRLIRRYGWWHLAFLEAVLRLADRLRSKEEAEQ